MIKLNRKLSISISFVVIVVYLLSIILNSQFIHKYYLHEKKQIINSIGEVISDTNIDTLVNNIDYYEDKYNATIVYAPINKSYFKDTDKLNENIVSEFARKGFTLKKFWVSSNDLVNLNNGSVNKIYNQGKMKYSLLVKFINKENFLVAVSIPIEHSSETVKIINNFNIIVGLISIVVITILIFALSSRIIKPIQKLKVLSNDISNLNFRKEIIKTNDEIEELANSINIMSKKLEAAHNELNKKNKDLKRFISDTSHELKTPVAIIKAYSMGVKDGLDDGTYIDTILEQNENMSKLINSLLYWARYETKKLHIEKIDLSQIVIKSLHDYKIFIEECNITVNFKNVKNKYIANGDKESISIVLNNLISNAIKYGSDKIIDIKLIEEKDNINLMIENKLDKNNNIDIKNIWEPFFVQEKSRNKELSGTGLGLTIVKTILEANKLHYEVYIINNKIQFKIQFKVKNLD